MIVSISAQPEHVAEDPMAGEALDPATLELLRSQISYTIVIGVQTGDDVAIQEFHLIISQKEGRHDWALFGASFTRPGGGDLYSGDEATQEAALAAAMRQAILAAAGQA